MNTIKCSCGYEKCSIHLFLRESSSSVDLVMNWIDSNELVRDRAIQLDPNSIVQLIKELKTCLTRIA